MTCAGLIQPQRIAEELFAGLGGQRIDADELAEAAAIAKHDDTGNLGKERIVLAAADVLARLEGGAALPHQNRSSGHGFSAESLHAQALGIGIAPVFGTA